MDGRIVRSIVIFIVFVCILVARNSECKRTLAQVFFGDGITINCRERNQGTAEEAWNHCRKEMKDSKKAVEDFDLYLPQAITDLPSEMKQTLLDCLRKKNVPLHVSGKEVGSKTWLKECLQLLYGWPNFPRRYLKHRPHHHRAESSGRTPPIEKSPNNAPSQISQPQPSLSPVLQPPAKPKRLSGSAISHPPPVSQEPSPSPISQPPRKTPKHSHAKTPKSSPPIVQPPAKTPKPSLPQYLKNSPHPSAVKHPPPIPPIGSPHPSEDKSGSRKYIVAAIAATAVAAFALVALLFVCCLKNNNNKMDPSDGQRDEKPLLNLSNMSGSSSVGNSSNKEFKTLSFVNSNGMAESQSLEATPEASGNIPAPKPPPPPPPKPPAPRPPPPPKIVRPPPIPPKSSNSTKRSPLGPHHNKDSSSGEGHDLSREYDAPKAKLKPLFWDKVPANPDHSMVWHEIKAGSFQFNEEMMETLFGYAAADKGKNEHRKNLSSLGATNQYIQIIDPKKSQNLAIILKALNVTTEEVLEALKEGNELPAELVQTLLKMAPTTEEELKLRVFSGDLSQLGPAERFLKVMVDIPFAFKRLESLLFMSYLQGEVSSIKESFVILEVACKELRNSRLFLKLLEAVLKTGNRMNDGTFRGDAQAFKLDTLLKLSDVKGTDGKTTLLRFVVQEIIRSEGIRAARRAKESRSMSSLKSEDLIEDPIEETEDHRNLGLQVVSELSNELENVRKAAVIDGDTLTATVSKLDHSLSQSREFLNIGMKSIEEESKFHDKLASFVQLAEVEIARLLEEEKSIMAQVKSTVDYFHGNAGKDEGLRLFVVVRDFLVMVDKTCKEVRNSVTMPMRNRRKEGSRMSSPSLSTMSSPSQEAPHSPLQDVRQHLFPAIRNLRINESSSDEEQFSP